MTLWVRLLILAGIASALLGAGAYWEHGRMQAILNLQVAKYNQFVGGTEAISRQATIDAEKQRLADIKAKERADESHDLRVALRDRTIAKLRADAQERDSRGGSVPAAPTGSKCPDGQVCFDRAEYQRALGEFDSEARRGADEGTKVTEEFDTVVKWHTQRDTK